MNKTAIIIPARYGSSRLEGKPLIEVNGKPIIQWVYEKAKQAKLAEMVIVATDDERIFNAVKAFGGDVEMTSAEHKCGSDRIREVVERHPEIAYIVNLQGDEPLIKPESIDDVARNVQEDEHADISTLIRVLKDEAAAPKAKANILRGLLSNVIDSEAMFQEGFQHVINHCINCGSCSIECPSKVNIPKLALEAKSRYAEKFGVSIDAKLATNFETAGRLTHKLSPLVSSVMAPKLMRKILKFTTGLTSERKFVRFATKSLNERVTQTEGSGEKVVMYFAGCYASYIKPEIGESTIRVLNKLGYKVVTPKQHCCGIPHLSKGLAKDARNQIKKNLKEWGNLIDQVDYIVSACSSCTLSLTKEWLYYQNDEVTQKIKDKTIFVMDLIENHINEIDLKENNMSLAYHMPCHKKLLKNANSSINVLKKLPGVETDKLNTGCCGMAGSWGMSAKNYDLSVKIGSPMVDKLNESKASIGVTECPTCTMQLEHLGKKKIMHPVEVVDKCID